MTITTRARALLNARNTLILATASKDGVPTASYAPFVHRDDCFYVYTSALSRHTSDMMENNEVSALVIEDEEKTYNIFARKRITFSCTVSVVSDEDDKHKEILDLFEKKFGHLISKKFNGKKIFADLIRELDDFTLFELDVREVYYVEGFAKAYKFDSNLSNPRHIKGTGPGAEHKK